jgi:hypothetical protein
VVCPFVYFRIFKSHRWSHSESDIFATGIAPYTLAAEEDSGSTLPPVRVPQKSRPIPQPVPALMPQSSAEGPTAGSSSVPASARRPSTDSGSRQIPPVAAKARLSGQGQQRSEPVVTVHEDSGMRIGPSRDRETVTVTDIPPAYQPD